MTLCMQVIFVFSFSSETEQESQYCIEGHRISLLIELQHRCLLCLNILGEIPICIRIYEMCSNASEFYADDDPGCYWCCVCACVLLPHSHLDILSATEMGEGIFAS